MDRFKIGDKVYSKEGNLGTELDTVAVLDNGKVFVRLFSNNFIQDYFPEELLTEAEYQQKFKEWENQLAKNDKDWSI